MALSLFWTFFQDDLTSEVDVPNERDVARFEFRRAILHCTTSQVSEQCIANVIITHVLLKSKYFECQFQWWCFPYIHTLQFCKQCRLLLEHPYFPHLYDNFIRPNANTCLICLSLCLKANEFNRINENKCAGIHIVVCVMYLAILIRFQDFYVISLPISFRLLPCQWDNLTIASDVMLQHMDKIDNIHIKFPRGYAQRTHLWW